MHSDCLVTGSGQHSSSSPTSQSSQRQHDLQNLIPPWLACSWWRIEARLASQRPVWSDMTSIDISEQWREDWTSASLVNNVLVADPNVWQPWFDLPRLSWTPLSRFQTDQEHCLANIHKWGSSGHIRPLRSATDDKPHCRPDSVRVLWQSLRATYSLHDAGDDAVYWPENVATTAFAKCEWKF